MRIKARGGGSAPLRAVMANLTLLLFACAFAAPLYAASIPDAEADLHRKIPAVLPEDLKEPSQTDSAHELVDQPEPVKQIENELRVKPAEIIPVEVVVENVEPSVKLNEVADDVEIVRPQPDLRNPGPPQRQEHETQNPEQHSDEQVRASTIKESIEETQKLLKQSFQDVTSDIQNWISNGDGQSKIQQNIKNLRETFSNQIQKLNDTIQALANPEDSKPAESQAAESQRDFKEIESRLKIIEDNFNNGVQTLSTGIDIVARLKSAGGHEEEVRQEQTVAEAPPAPVANPAPAAQPAPPAQPALPNPPQNILLTMMAVIANRTREGITSVQNLILPNNNQNTQNPPSNVQADTPIGSTSRPPWSQITDWFNQQNSPWSFITQQVQGGQNPISGFFGIFTNPLGSFSSTVKPPASSPVAEDKPSVPKPETEPSKPTDVAADSPPAAQASPQEPVGPIRQFLNNNPITQGLVTTVQRIQGSITSSDTPRVPAEKSDLKKGGWYGKPGNSDDNNDSGMSEQKPEEIKEPIQEEPKKEAEDIVEEKPQVVPEKTE